ncbi:MAG: protein NO VEIN domain-containing protein [Metallibacterium sp.]
MLITKIEQAAVAAAKTHFKKQGYEVESFEQDNRGWDIEARKGGEHLLIEVKGHIGNAIQFELTPNEYSKLQANSPRYRVCILRNALLGDTNLEIYAPRKVGGEWRLKRLDRPGEIRFKEKIAARAFES